MVALEEFRKKIWTVGSKPLYANLLIIGGSTFLFLLAIEMIGDALGLIGKDYTRYIFDATSNPSVGLFIGLLSTAILQSSSTTTSMAVAAVAAGSLTLEHAVPIIIGANIGTTLTSTIVSVSYITKKAEFKKAMTAGSVHDIFNVLVVLFIFPLEVKYGILTNSSRELAALINSTHGGTTVTESFVVYRLFHEINTLVLSLVGPYIALVLSVILLIATVKYISGLLYKQLIGNARRQFQTVVFNSTLRSFGWGALLTSAIQSSSLTTSLIVPLAATGQVSMKRAFQFVLGANLGTTVTALIAALFRSEAAISLAFAHLLFNLFGVFLFLFVPLLKELPLYLAEKLSDIAIRWKITAFAYILMVFFVLPYTLILFSQKDQKTEENKEEIVDVRRSKQTQLKLQSNFGL